jgi:hypothetical protein
MDPVFAKQSFCVDLVQKLQRHCLLEDISPITLIQMYIHEQQQQQQSFRFIVMIIIDNGGPDATAVRPVQL